MRSLLLHANGDDGFEGRLQAALDLARQFDAHITCLQPVSFEIAFPGDTYGTMLAQMLPVVREAAARFRGETEARLAKEDVRWEWIEEDGIDDSCVIAYAALSDLVVISAAPRDAGRGGPSPLVGQVAIHGRAPLLVMPKEWTGLDTAGPAFVAWNGSAEASRALRAAMPFLKRASGVVLGTVAEGDTRDRFDMPPLRGAGYLARHGIECEVVELPRASAGVAATLEDAARARGARYMVMGAYGHSRLMQTLFGGVTRHALSTPSMPLLMAH